MGLQRPKKIAVGLVAQTVGPRQFLPGYAYITAGTQQTGRGTGLEFLHALVGDVKGRRHLVAVLGFITAGRKIDLLYHIGIDHRQAFLLAAAYKEGTENFDIIYIYAVLVKTAAAHVVLRGELAVGRYTGLPLYQLFHGIARGRGHRLHVLGIQLLGLRGLTAYFGYHHFVQLVVARHVYHKGLLAAGLVQHTGLRLVAYHRVAYRYTVRTLKGDAVFAFQISKGYLALTHTGHGGKLQCVALLIKHFAR